jgi:hypothetical protein
MTRIYVPATVAELAEWHAAGAVPAAAFADAYEAPDETEEGEYAALMSAADEAFGRLVGAGRRIVLVVDDGAAAPVPFNEVLAVHADLEERPAGADPDEDLGWFGVQEIPSLLD